MRVLSCCSKFSSDPSINVVDGHLLRPQDHISDCFRSRLPVADNADTLHAKNRDPSMFLIVKTFHRSSQHTVRNSSTELIKEPPPCVFEEPFPQKADETLPKLQHDIPYEAV